MLIDEVRNVLFGIPNAPGTDLAARDIQRARDHGIGTYNQVRVAYSLPAVTSFSQITSNATVQNELRATYGTVDKIDPFIGMLAEDHVAGADVGPTVEAILVKQFAALRDGDRFFYLNESFTPAEASLIQQGSTLGQVIEDNTPITNLQTDVFRFTAQISGTVFNDLNGNGVQDAGEGPLSGRIVTLEDTSGNVIATTRTDSNGHYVFSESSGIPGTGQFQVLAANLPNGVTVTTPNPAPAALTKGDDVVTVIIGEVKHIRSGSTGAAATRSGGGGGAVQTTATSGGSHTRGAASVRGPSRAGNAGTNLAARSSSAAIQTASVSTSLSATSQQPTGTGQTSATGSTGSGLGTWDLGTPLVAPGASLAVLQSGDSLTGLTGSDWSNIQGMDALGPSL
jgi:hypothetical protein